MAELKIDSGSIDPIQLRTYETIIRVASNQQVPFIIVGASARDLVMHHAYGAPIQRATRDIDLAIQVPDWEGFESMRSSLIAEGYSESRIPHRLFDPQGVPLDIIPFGPLENANSKIAWPPDGDIEMGVMGFQEALDNADRMIVKEHPVLEFPVASPAGFSLLKLVAWSERDAQLRRKDAADLVYLLTNYENVSGFIEQLYEDCESVLEKYDWDTRLSGAHMLGVEIAEIATAPSLQLLRGLLDDDGVANLGRDAGLDPEGQDQALIEALRTGLFES